MTSCKLDELEREAFQYGLLLRLQVRRPLGCWALRLVVAKNVANNKVKILGEMKAWAYGGINGLQLDTIRIASNSDKGVAHLVWLATMAWAIEETPCIRARLLAIRDEEEQHSLLTRYFQQRGFQKIREVGAGLLDLPLRMVWGGAGTLMMGDCAEVYERSLRLWRSSIQKE